MGTNKIEVALDENFWSSRYEEGNIGWDLGQVSTPIKEYIDQLQDKSLKIIIPGGGNSYEAQYLFNNGYMEVHVVDLAAPPLANIKKRIPDFPSDQLIKSNFFDIQGDYDLIIEQTFFCALNPQLRPDYVNQCARLLKEGGKIVGLMFGVPLNDDKPPFGGCKEDYIKLFEPQFDIEIMTDAYNSMSDRMGHELFVKFRKK